LQEDAIGTGGSVAFSVAMNANVTACGQDVLLSEEGCDAKEQITLHPEHPVLAADEPTRPVWLGRQGFSVVSI
jgi:hypothetical protein